MSRSGGIGLGGILLVVFIVLKLTGNIDWSWWWVLSPFWIPAVIVFGFIVLDAWASTPSRKSRR